MDEARARRDMVADTMRYAKRQMTWFRHQAQAHWFEEGDAAFRFAVEWLRA
jgi:tRNA A37 N6-isopentenylltransferase MiaA